MKKLFVIGSIFLLILTGNAYAWTCGSTCTGADGALDLSVTPPVKPSYVTIVGTTATVALSSTGIMNLTKMNVPSGWTVNFTKNTTNTPVYILASDASATSVIINGTIDVSGGSVAGCDIATPGAGGPGGYSGGYGGPTGEPGGKGLGPGGGEGGPTYDDFYAGGGGYGTPGGTYNQWQGAGGSAYGNVNILPIIGGSGGGGSFGRSGKPGWGGSGGGGAIVMASSGTITINGAVKANGGNTNCYDWAGSGSGGAIKLMANYISGSGTLSAKGGNQTNSTYGGQGRIRLEAASSNTFNSGGSDPACTFTNTPGSVMLANAPTLTITSIAGVTPLSRVGSYSSPDITLVSGSSNVVTVNISAQNIPTTAVVSVAVIPQYGDTSQYGATFNGTTGSATVTLSTDYANVVVAQATFTMTASMYYDNEKIEKVRVAASMGKESETVYITQSGKEIPAKELKLAGLVK